MARSKLKAGQTVTLTMNVPRAGGGVLLAGTKVTIRKTDKQGYYCDVGNIGFYFFRSDLEKAIAVKEETK